MPYGLGMAARKRPTPDDAATARRILLDGLADGTETFKLLGDVEPLHPRDDTFPGEVFLRLAADALDWCGASRADVPVRQACEELVRRPVDPAP